MAWCEVQPSRLQFLSIFGYQIIHEDDTFILGEYEDEVFIIDKVKPIVWFDDVGEAMQLGVIGIIQGP